MAINERLKVVVIGESGVGKSSVIKRYINQKFDDRVRYRITGIDYATKNIQIGDDIVLLNIWDTAGCERFQMLHGSFYRNADICVLVYDICDKKSFMAIEKWRNVFLTECNPINPECFPFLLLCNKMDKIGNLTDYCHDYNWFYNDKKLNILLCGYCKGGIDDTLKNIMVPKDIINLFVKFCKVNRGELYAKEHNIMFYETSAKDGTNINDAFESIAEKACYRKQKMREQLQSQNESTSFCITL